MKKIIQLKDIDSKIYPVPNEVINNDNGTALKYADGTLICYGKKDNLKYNPADMWSWCDRTDKLSFNFAMSFNDIPVVSLTTNTFTVVSINVATISKNGVSFYAFQPKNCGTTSLSIQYIAIGSWK